MTVTAAQMRAAGAAARTLLELSWERQPRVDNDVIVGIRTVARTISTNVSESVLLLRRVIEKSHLKKFGYAELPWLAREIHHVFKSAPDFAVEVYAAAYAHEEKSDDKTNIGNSVLMSLTSNKRQDYGSALHSLAEAAPRFLEANPIAATRAIARAIEGYIQRKGSVYAGGDTNDALFSIGSAAAKFVSDFSHTWYRGGLQPVQDAPLLLSKFDAYLDRIGPEKIGAEQFIQVRDALATEGGNAVLWASLLVAGKNHPEQLASALVPLASATPIMVSGDTRTQLGEFIKAGFAHLSQADRAAIERAIVSLTGQRPERSKSILAGCIPTELIATDEMRAYRQELEKAGPPPPVVPPYRIEATLMPFGTDEHLAMSGVSLDDPANLALRNLMRSVEEFARSADQSPLTLASAKQHLADAERLLTQLKKKTTAALPPQLVGRGWSILVEACHRLARANPQIINSQAIRPSLGRALIECAKSPDPAAVPDDEFHENLTWDGFSTRASAATALLDLVRADKDPNTPEMRQIKKLSRDPAPQVRVHVIRDIQVVARLDTKWAWSELEHVATNEPARGVVAGMLHALSRVTFLDVPRTIGIAKEVIARYPTGDAEGKGFCRANASIIILNAHVFADNPEADAFAKDFLSDTIANAEVIKTLIAQYSDRLLGGEEGKPDAPDHQYRKKVLAFYDAAVTQAFGVINERFNRLGAATFGTWPEADKEVVRSMFGIVEEASLRLYFASGARSNGGFGPPDSITKEQARLFKEARPTLERLADAVVAAVAHNLIQMLEADAPLEPAGVFSMIARAVRSSERGGYGGEQMGATVVVRIVERYLADYRWVFTSDPARLADLMDCLDVFVRAGWPEANSLVFRLGDIWR